ncbi:PE-PPE domain-containing protein [Gordonia sp. NPDC003429]
MITYITVCGTGEHPGNPGNMLNIAAGILGGSVEHVDLAYPASIACFNPYGDVSGVSEAESRRQGVANLAAAIRATPNLVVISGYSLGALVVSDFMDAKAHGQYADCEVLAVVNIANPARAAGVSYGLPSFGFGLDGQHKPWLPGVDVYEIANPVDAITSAPWDSPWRIAADKVRAFNASVEGASAWFADMIAQLDGQEAAQAQENWWNAGFWQAYAQAPAWLRGYLYDGQHTTAYGAPRWYNESGQRVTGQQLVADVVSKYK